MGASLLQGKFSDLMKMGTPAYIHSHKSYLHMIVKDLSFLEHYVEEAMKQPNDPIWKLKHIVLTATSALHLAAE